MEPLFGIISMDYVIGACSLIFGLVIGWVIWGRRASRLIALEDELASTRNALKQAVKSGRMEPRLSGETITQHGRNEEVTPALSRQFREDRAASLAALSTELAEVRRLLQHNRPDIDRLKESLDQADTAIKRANGRVLLTLRSVERAETRGGKKTQLSDLSLKKPMIHLATDGGQRATKED